MADELSFEVVADSMRRLATYGLKACAQRLKQLSRQNLDGFINPSDGNVRYELSDAVLRNGGVKHFQPLPLPNSGFHLAFFRPTFSPIQTPNECKIEVILVADTQGKEIVGFRFERGTEKDDTHPYPHVQLTRIFRDGLETDWPTFVPQSYPAFPTRCRSLGDTWLAVLVSLYGLSASTKFGLEEVILRAESELRIELGPKLLPRSRQLFDEAA